MTGENPTEKAPTCNDAAIDESDSAAQNALTSRSVRSFVVRNGRITPAQQTALEQLMPRYGIDFSNHPLTPDTAFERAAPLWVEIGFGSGDTLLSLAERFSEYNFLGIEVHAPGVGHLLNGIEEHQLSNLRVIRHDAVEVLEQMLPPNSIDRALVLFPDPWPKKRHHKRRLVNPDFIELLASRLKTGGVLHCATDWQEYADEMLQQLQSCTCLLNQSSDKGFCDQPDYRQLTRFEKRGMRLGHDVFDLVFERINTAAEPAD